MFKKLFNGIKINHTFFLCKAIVPVKANLEDVEISRILRLAN